MAVLFRDKDIDLNEDTLIGASRIAGDPDPGHIVAPEPGDNSDPPVVYFVEDGRLQRVFDAYQTALELHAIVAVTDRRGKILFVNSRFCKISGYSAAELVGRDHNVVNSGHHPPGFFADMWRSIASGKLWHGEICNRSKSGALYWVDTTVVPIRDGAGRIEAYVSIRYDITHRKAVEQALMQETQERRKAEELLRDVIDTIPDGVAAFDAEDRLIVHNRSYAEDFGRSRDAIRIGATFESILRHGLADGAFALHRHSPEARENWLQARLRDHRRPGRKTIQAMADGRWFQIRERRSASGNVVGTRTDISELKRSEAAIKHLAERDPLTSLFNRSVLEPRLGQAIAESARAGTTGAVVTIDLDDFKQVNDTLGHAAGDHLLANVGKRLEATLRKTDIAIRLGGDEFAIILTQIDPKDIDNLCRRLLKALTSPTKFEKTVIKPRLSMGLAVFPRDGRTVERLLQKADIALYQAKSSPQAKYCRYSRALHARIEGRRKLAGALAAAVEADRIEIALQPQFQLKDGAHNGFESLARWTHGGQPVSPADFIPIAEESGLAKVLGERVIEKTLAALRNLKAHGLDTGRTAINLSEQQIAATDFPQRLERMVRTAGLKPWDLELELTENILLDREKEQIDRNLRALRSKGFSVALDDFGTGFASLSHLSRYAIDTIKIDRSFVTKLPGELNSFAIVRAMVGLAHDLGMQVVAEGIETEDQLALLRELGCDLGQGYLVSPPLAPDAVPDFLARRRDGQAPTSPIPGEPFPTTGRRRPVSPH